MTEEKIYYMFNKPAGFLTAMRDDKKPTIMEFFPEDLPKGFHPVGRLDYDTHGLLIMTNDGRVDRSLLQPSHHVTKRYFFYAIGTLTADKINRLEHGVYIGSSGIMSGPAKIFPDRTFTVGDIENYLPEFRRNRYMKNPQGPAFSASLEITEGKKHQVKLMLRAVDCKIVRLTRTSFAGIELDPELPEGKYRPLNPDEMEIIASKLL